jgi:hypothetical protein
MKLHVNTPGMSRGPGDYAARHVHRILSAHPTMVTRFARRIHRHGILPQLGSKTVALPDLVVSVVTAGVIDQVGQRGGTVTVYVTPRFLDDGSPCSEEEETIDSFFTLVRQALWHGPERLIPINVAGRIVEIATNITIGDYNAVPVPQDAGGIVYLVPLPVEYTIPIDPATGRPRAIVEAGG